MDRFERWQYRGLLDEDDPGGGGEDPPKKEGEGPSKTEPKGVPEEVLPEELRGRSPAEVKFLLEKMVEGTAQTAELRTQLRELQQKLETPEPEEDPNDDIPTEELIVQDPEAAVLRVLRKRGLLDRFEGLESRADEAVFDTVGRSIPDFEEYRDDVQDILKRTRVPMTRDNIMGAYTMAVGNRAIEERTRETKSTAQLETPEGEPPDTKDKYPPLQGLEKEIFEASDMSREDWERYKADDDIQMEVPTG